LRHRYRDSNCRAHRFTKRSYACTSEIAGRVGSPRVAEVGGYCPTAVPRDSSASKYASIREVIPFEAGNGPPGVTGSINGGTGDYAGATGTYEVVLGEERPENTFTFTLP
jgi:hypothetical protein